MSSSEAMPLKHCNEHNFFLKLNTLCCKVSHTLILYTTKQVRTDNTTDERYNTEVPSITCLITVCYLTLCKLTYMYIYILKCSQTWSLCRRIIQNSLSTWPVSRWLFYFSDWNKVLDRHMSTWTRTFLTYITYLATLCNQFFINDSKCSPLSIDPLYLSLVYNAFEQFGRLWEVTISLLTVTD